MKNLYIPLITIVIIILSLFISNTIKAQNDELITYRQEGIFSIDYPSNWKYEKIGTETVIFFPPDGKENSLSIIYGNLIPAEELTLENASEELEKIFKENFPGAIEAEIPRQVVTGNARAMLYHMILNSENKKRAKEILLIISISKGSIFIITAQSPVEKFSDYENTYLKMIKNFKAPLPVLLNTPTPTVRPTETPAPTVFNPLQTLPEKIEGWTIFNEEKNAFSFQYPEAWYIENKSFEEMRSIDILPEKNQYSENKISIIYFKIISGEETTIDTEKLAVDLSYQMEASGYTITEKNIDKFCNFPAAIIKTDKKGSDREIKTNLTAFQRGAYMIQIFFTYEANTDTEFINMGEKILETFRPFSIDEDDWW